MGKPRLGRAERLLKRQVFEGARRAQLMDMESRAAAIDGTSAGFSTVKPYAATMTHGLYRGLYDPGYSTERDTRRGLHAPKHKPAKSNGHGPVRSLSDGTL